MINEVEARHDQVVLVGAKDTGDAYGLYGEASKQLMCGGAIKGAGVVFGHGARHLAGTALSQSNVESAILQHLRASVGKASMTGNFWGRVVVDGTTIEYRAFTLADGTINVGTYYTIP
jgi:hypothetical protein